MTEKEYTKREMDMAQFHQQITDDLKYIKKQTTETNGKVRGNREDIDNIIKDIARIMPIISNHSQLVSSYKEERDQLREDVIRDQRAEIEELKEKKNSILKPAIYVGIALLWAVANATGVINFELPI